MDKDDLGFDSALASPENKTTTYFNGIEQLSRIGGSLAWRNNNPGNLKYGTEQGAIADGAIGGYPSSGGYFGIFPNKGAGEDALEKWWDRQPDEMTVGDAMDRYAPESENDTNAYRDHINGKVDINKSIGDLTDNERTELLDVIKRHEGWVDGREESVLPEKFDVKNESQAKELMKNEAYDNPAHPRHEDVRNAVDGYYKDAYGNKDKVIYIWHTELRPTTCGYCEKMNGRQFAFMSDIEKLPPVHDNCGCSIARMHVPDDN